MEHNDQVRNALRKEYKESDDYKNKRREIHELVVTAWQTHLKTGLDYSVGVTRRGNENIKEEDVKEVEDTIMRPIVDKYVEEHSNLKSIPHEDKLVTDLIFESLTSEGIEDLMNKFIEPYL